MDWDITRAQKHIDTLEPAVSGSGGHAATYRAARILVNDYKLSVEEAWPILLSYNERCEPPWTEKELRRKLEDAAKRPPGNYGTDKSQGRKTPNPAPRPPSERIAKGPAKYNPPPKAPIGPPAIPQLDSAMLAALAEKGAPVLDRFFLANISSTDPALVTPDMYLRGLFDVDRGERTIIFADRKTQGQCLWPDQANRIPTDAPDGIIFLGQPIDGNFRMVNGKKTRRSSECVLSWRHALLEADHMDNQLEWLQALITLPLPIISITFSGSRSLHVLFKLEASTHEEWRGYVDQLKPALALIGADVQALTNHLVMPRLPGCWRTVNGKKQLQQLLYFNPRPITRPLLYATQLRHVEQDWTTRAAEIASAPQEWPPDAIRQAAAACTAYGLQDALKTLTPFLPASLQ